MLIFWRESPVALSVSHFPYGETTSNTPTCPVTDGAEVNPQRHFVSYVTDNTFIRDFGGALLCFCNTCRVSLTQID